jgi:hypothetical protein
VETAGGSEHATLRVAPDVTVTGAGLNHRLPRGARSSLRHLHLRDRAACGRWARQRLGAVAGPLNHFSWLCGQGRTSATKSQERGLDRASDSA